MTWALHYWSWQLDGPLYVGAPPAGSLNRARLYVPARALWGAVTAELARLEGTDHEMPSTTRSGPRFESRRDSHISIRPNAARTTGVPGCPSTVMVKGSSGCASRALVTLARLRLSVGCAVVYSTLGSAPLSTRATIQLTRVRCARRSAFKHAGARTTDLSDRLSPWWGSYSRGTSASSAAWTVWRYSF